MAKESNERETSCALRSRARSSRHGAKDGGELTQLTQAEKECDDQYFYGTLVIDVERQDSLEDSKQLIEEYEPPFATMIDYVE